MAERDRDSALELVSMLESIGELDAGTSADVRAEVTANMPPDTVDPSEAADGGHGAEDRDDRVDDRHGAADWTALPARSDPQWYAAERCKRERQRRPAAAHPKASPESQASPEPEATTPRESDDGPAHVGDYAPSRPAAHQRPQVRPVFPDERQGPAPTKPSTRPYGREAATRSKYTPQSQPSADPSASVPAHASADQSNRATVPEARRGIAFREAFWKRRVNMQTAQNARTDPAAGAAQNQRSASGSCPASPRRPSKPRVASMGTHRSQPYDYRQFPHGRDQEDEDDSGFFEQGFTQDGDAKSTTESRQPAGLKGSRSVPLPKQRPWRPTAVGAEAPERDGCPSFSPRGAGAVGSRHGSTARRAPAAASQTNSPTCPNPAQSRPPSAPSGQPASGSQPRSSTAPPPRPTPPPKATAPPTPPPKAAAPPPKAAPRADRRGSSGSAKVTKPSGNAKALELLELRPDFTPEDLRAAYKKAAMKWHPDRPAWRAAGEEEMKKATEMFQQIKDAYDYLSGKPAR